MEIIIGALVIFFIVRFFYVMGRAKSTRERHSSDNREIFSLCKAKGMDLSDIHSVEYDPKAMALVKESFSKITAAGRRSDRARNEIIADCMHAIWQRKEKSFVAYVVINWGIDHGLPQFEHFTNRFTKGEPLSLSEDDIEEVYGLETLDAEVGWTYYTWEPISYIPDEVFMLPNLECLYVGWNGPQQDLTIQLQRIPESIQQARKLKSLRLQYCGLTELPRHIFIPSLQDLSISNNNIKIIPDGIENATSLRVLSACMNDLEYVSEKIGTLKSLKHIDLLWNPNLRLPKSIVNLGKMEELYTDEDLPDLTQEQMAWLKENNYLYRKGWLKENNILHRPEDFDPDFLLAMAEETDDEIPF